MNEVKRQPGAPAWIVVLPLVAVVAWLLAELLVGKS